MTADTEEVKRHQCEVRECLRNGADWFKRFCADVKQKRGAAAAQRLWDDVKRQHQLGNTGQPGEWIKEPT